MGEASKGPPRGLSAWLGAFFVFFDVVIRRVDGKTKTDHRNRNQRDQAQNTFGVGFHAKHGVVQKFIEPFCMKVKTRFFRAFFPTTNFHSA